MFGQEATLLGDIVYGLPLEDTEQCRPVEFVAEQQRKLQEAISLVREHLNRAPARRKVRYEQTRPCNCERGTSVCRLTALVPICDFPMFDIGPLSWLTQAINLDI